jgi:hypothetical protein
MTEKIRIPHSALRTPSARRWFAMLSVLLLAGCGADLYEERLENTKVVFARIDLLNQHLQSLWTDGDGVGVRLRVPQQFGLLPPPAKPDPSAQPAAKPAEGDEAAGNEEGAAEAEIHDDRQPAYMSVELPGLRGAWKAEVNINAENNVAVKGEAFVYVMSNHHLADKVEEAEKFSQEFIKALAEAAHVPPPDETAWETLTFPAKKGQFVKPRKYNKVGIDPDEPVGDLVRQFSMYIYTDGKVQVIVLFVLPKDVDNTSEKFAERIPLCLETLEASNQLVKPTAGGGPAPTSGANF